MILGEIRMFAGAFIPKGWAACQGQELQIEEHQLLYGVLGTTYGGDGLATFRLPDMASEANGVVPMHQGDGAGLTPRTLGQTVGSNELDMTAATAPPHTHQLMASADTALEKTPSRSTVLAKGPGTAAGGDLTRFYSSAAPNSVMASELPLRIGHIELNFNMMSGLKLNFIIALEGEYPSRDIPTATESLIGEVSIVPYNFVPVDWLACDGQTLQGDEYPELNAIIGLSGERGSFRTPNMQIRVPTSKGSSIGRPGATGSNTGRGYWPDHSHTVRVDNTTPGSAASADPGDHVLGSARFQGSTDNNVYYQDQGEGNAVLLDYRSVSDVGEFPKPNTKNMQPYLGVQFCICARGGIFPERP